jgi:hypothetical protein
MRKSILYETVIKELTAIGKLNSHFTKLDLKRLYKIHQKYVVFVYKHSDLKNQGKMTLYFKRGSSTSNYITFCVDEDIYKQYCSTYTIA